ncbi:unnamed protein product [Schistocephalus solidus]|uniref:Uncharacterized protein n=1 Tax=Schistocephalus solidus TaxID=70667 RepID=A0A3P7F0I0_SCHSO|nr:unnamed protein product [Schistocephalus solidus]
MRSTDFFLALNIENGGENCRRFKQELYPGEPPVSIEEKEFPLAFALAVYRSINQVARLLRLIYRPHNAYVIHVDRKSSAVFYDAVVEVQRCFGSNVRVVPRDASVNVIWGDYTVLELELIAAGMLLKMGGWKYLINLTGQELPLKTNLELVRALSRLNGSNIISASLKHRYEYRIPKRKMNFSVTWLKGAVHVVLRREFVHFMLQSPKAVEIRETLRLSSYHKHPDEQFFATLAYNAQLGAPGACLRIHEPEEPDFDATRHSGIVRYKIWHPDFCPSKYARDICILGSRSLPELLTAPQLFANKFHEDYFAEGYDCLEFELARRAYEGPSNTFDPSLYSKLYCTLKHI